MAEEETGARLVRKEVRFGVGRSRRVERRVDARAAMAKAVREARGCVEESFGGESPDRVHSSASPGIPPATTCRTADVIGGQQSLMNV